MDLKLNGEKVETCIGPIFLYGVLIYGTAKKGLGQTGPNTKADMENHLWNKKIKNHQRSTTETSIFD